MYVSECDPWATVKCTTSFENISQSHFGKNCLYQRFWELHFPSDSDHTLPRQLFGPSDSVMGYCASHLAKGHAKIVYD